MPPPVEIYKLTNTVKHYDWGSAADIPALLGEKTDGRNWAELWMGVHPGGPSKTEKAGQALTLAELIAENPPHFLGRAGETFHTLPFLFKLLAAGKPLSIQAHPAPEQAAAGFERENKAGVPLEAACRNYKDPSHKPEILCAITPFTAMCGFREPGEICQMLDAFFERAPLSLGEGIAPLKQALKSVPVTAALKAFFRALFTLAPQTMREITGFVTKNYSAGESAADGKTTGGEFSAERDCAALFAGLYPGDPGILAPLYLNLIHLEAGEAIYLPAGVLHAYVHGFGVELMSNSDNVLRGGLTSKHVDLKELMAVLNFVPFAPEILKAQKEAPGWGRYITPAGEFSLSFLRGRDTGSALVFNEQGPVILIVTGGEMRIRSSAAKEGTAGACRVLRKGESAFIPPQALKFSGRYTAFAAGLPPESEPGSRASVRRGP
jgi:mannose-6-phosphate isomerase